MQVPFFWVIFYVQASKVPYNPLVPDAHYSEGRIKQFWIFFTKSTIGSQFTVKLRINIFCTLKN